MSFANIPSELKMFRQWCLWRLEWKKDDPAHVSKPTKIPYQTNGWGASVVDPRTWNTFNAVCAANIVAHIEPCEPNTPTSQTGFTGIGFVFSEYDPFFGGDCDDTHGDKIALARQQNWELRLNTYSEFSPSGSGVHFIGKGVLPGKGRNRNYTEVYDRGRFFTMTGNVYRNAPIRECQDVLEELYKDLEKPAASFVVGLDQEQTQTDEEIIAAASTAENGYKFLKLMAGDWREWYGPEHGHNGIGQSEADFALLNIIAFYTQNRAQVIRIFQSSKLGEREKSKRLPLLNHQIDRAFDRQLPPVDIDGLNIAFEKLLQERAAVLPSIARQRPLGSNSTEPFGPERNDRSASDIPITTKSEFDLNVNPYLEEAARGETERKTLAPNLSTPSEEGSGGRADEGLSAFLDKSTVFPSGLVGEVAQFVLDAAPQPVRKIALAAAIGYLAGICGRAWNISGSGVNQYILMLAETGRGKEAIQSGLSRLNAAIQFDCPGVLQFVGPTFIASEQALVKALSRYPSLYCLIGEFGLELKSMSDPKAPAHKQGLRKELMNLYQKSGLNSTSGSMAYSKKDDNVASVTSPALTLIGESTLINFYENVTENTVLSGLLPRFTIFEYEGDQQNLREGAHLVEPSIDLCQKLKSYIAQAQMLNNQQKACDVLIDADAKIELDAFRQYQQHVLNNCNPKTGKRLVTKYNPVKSEIWNRVHLKALKLAALVAIGRDMNFPHIELDTALWAIETIREQTKSLQKRFDDDEIGANVQDYRGQEQKQIDMMIRIISQWACNPYEKYAKKYLVPEEMWEAKIFPYIALDRRLRTQICFANDRRGPVPAIANTYKLLCDNGDLVEVPNGGNDGMQKRFGRKCRAFAIANAERFVEKKKDGD